MSRRVALLTTALAACHVHEVSHGVRRSEPRTELVGAPAEPAEPTIELGPAGELRLLRPVRCAAEIVVDVEDVETTRTRPNLAAFVVGVAATGLGLVATIAASTGDDPGTDPLLYGGGALLVGGVPLLVGPWRGLAQHRHASPPRREVVRTEATRCGEAPLPGPARVGFDAFRGHGAVDPAGTFALSAFTWVDAYALDGHAWLVTAEGTGWSARLALDGEALLRARDGFLAGAGLDARVGPGGRLPSLVPGGLAVTRTVVGGAPALRVTLPLTNDGAGDAWQVRAHLSSSRDELDGRVLYVGHVPRRATLRPELVIPLSPSLDLALRGAPIDLALRLHDAAASTSTHPLQFRGMPLSELPGAP